ncbi:hypothetical protein EST35_0304 [Pseudomonas phage vB_PaeM_PA5oct]|uniref:Uncharacterized protein n=1 Tax=Pseudomonas phage vB_PaeM_PA5oct TaxID=2163605 RepID=A0A4Y5JV10_9CAUD|nr:hypothetical protein PQE65_gp180 [Pseudomonas phage vB_PaeM_PA5oct]QCG76185.1 hypothetical protein EST35_0304 [Pseudomonas phage vB_PaeM_PA5oct]
MIKSFLLSAVSNVLQFGKKGGKITYTPETSSFKIETDNDVLCPIAVGPASTSTHAVPKSYVDGRTTKYTMQDDKTVSGSTLSAITEFTSISLEANTTYSYTLLLLYSSDNTAAGIKYQLMTNGSLTRSFSSVENAKTGTASTLVNGFVLGASATITVTTVAIANNLYNVWVQGFIENSGGSPDTLTISLASSSSSASCSAYAGSQLIMTRL